MGATGRGSRRTLRRRLPLVSWALAIGLGLLLGGRDAPRGDPRWSTTTDCGTNFWPQCATGRGTFVSYALLVGAASALLAAVAWRVQARLARRGDPLMLHSPPGWRAIDGFRRVGLPVFVVVMLVGGGYFVLVHPTRYDSSFVRRLPDGFGAREAFAVDATDPARARATVASILQRQYHVPADQAACMTARAFGGEEGSVTTRPTVVLGPRNSYMLEADELNALAIGCGVDFSGLWYMTD